jgi:hypothetical protein
MQLHLVQSAIYSESYHIGRNQRGIRSGTEGLPLTAALLLLAAASVMVLRLRSPPAEELKQAPCRSANRPPFWTGPQPLEVLRMRLEESRGRYIVARGSLF